MKTRRGAALAEYGLLTGLVALVALVAVGELGGKVEETFTDVGMSLSGVAQASPGAANEPEEPSGPPPATGAAAMDFTLTLHQSYREYGHGSMSGSGVEVGSVDAYEGLPSHLIQLRYEVPSSRVFFRVAGNFAAELVDHTLSCDDGLNLPLNEAGTIYYEPTPDRTMAYWNNVPDAFLIEGSTITCRVSDS